MTDSCSGYYEGQEENECFCSSSLFYAEQIHELDCDSFRIIYWYHPDYLGHNEFITDKAGKAYQYFHYSAFSRRGFEYKPRKRSAMLARPSPADQRRRDGETLVQEDVNYGKFDAPWRFNGKELDQETGNYYYGARYYNPTWSVWLSVDRMAAKYPNSSSYVFSGNNPILFVDPNGDSLKTSSQGWQIIKDALVATLGGTSGFFYNEERQTVVFDKEFEIESQSYEGPQLELVRRLRTITDSESHFVDMEVVRREERIEIKGETSTLRDADHTDGAGANGLTELVFGNFDESGNLKSSYHRVFIGSNPKSSVSGLVFGPYRGLAFLHEVTGHVYENIRNPAGIHDLNNRNTTKWENIMRSLWNNNAAGTVFRGKAHDHFTNFSTQR